MKKITLFAFLFLLILRPQVVTAHGQGMTFSATSTSEDGKSYIVDVDFADTAIVADAFGRFDFNLFSDAKRTEPAPFTDLWVRIVQKNGEKRGKTLYAGSVAKAQLGGTGFSIVLPEGGEYMLSVRYNDASKDTWGETVAEAEFPLTVLRSYDENKFTFGTEFWIGIFAGLFSAAVGILPLLVRKR